MFLQNAIVKCIFLSTISNPICICMERYCRKHLITWPKRTKVGDIFRCVMSLPQKHNFEMDICGFDFDAVNMEDDIFFLEDRFSTFDRDLKNKKNNGPHESWGGAWTAPRAPQLIEEMKHRLVSVSQRSNTSSEKICYSIVSASCQVVQDH